uniref:MADF domain-containing protein n=1 Tax=Rhabditophanes sp. KR3021 TaxID=114890 RepID=A0AC35UGD3_9BILA
MTSLADEELFVTGLIEVVKQNACLYDSQDKKYRSSEYKIQLWVRILEKMKSIDPTFDGDSRTLHSKWKQLRDKYGKERKKAKLRGVLPSWQYYKHLHFLNPFMTEREAVKPGSCQKHEVQQAADHDPMFYQKIIEEVKKHPCLYDSKNPAYRQSSQRMVVWANIISNLQFPGNVQDMYKQWKKIRDRFVREKRRRRMMSPNMRNGPVWPLYKYMTWMETYVEERQDQKLKKELDELEEMMDVQGEFLVDDYQSYSNEMQVNNDMIVVDPHEGEELMNGVHTNYFSPSISPNYQYEQHQNGNLQQNHINGHVDEVSEGIPNKVNVPKALMDGDISYAISVIMDLNSLNNEAKHYAKQKILEVFNDRYTT